MTLDSKTQTWLELAENHEETGIELPENRGKFLLKLNPHYMGTRYPDDLLQLYKQYTLEYATALHQETLEIFQWFKEHLMPKK